LAKGYKPVTVGECLGDPQENWYRTDPSSTLGNGCGRVTRWAEIVLQVIGISGYEIRRMVGLQDIGMVVNKAVTQEKKAKKKHILPDTLTQTPTLPAQSKKFHILFKAQHMSVQCCVIISASG
jgi:hypothetical protein